MQGKFCMHPCNHCWLNQTENKCIAAFTRKFSVLHQLFRNSSCLQRLVGNTRGKMFLIKRHSFPFPK